MNIEKSELVRIFTQQLERDLEAITAAARATHEAATHEESKPENKYDTRGLEAAYLAGAQAKRVQEIREVLSLFQTLPFKDFSSNDAVQSTALVEVALDGKRNILLVMPKGGGVQMTLSGETVQIITPASHLGEAILGLKVSESVEFEMGHKVRVCEIISIQ